MDQNETWVGNLIKITNFKNNFETYAYRETSFILD